MRKIKLFLPVLALPFLAACSTTPGAQDVGGCTEDGNAAVGCVVTIQYKGKPLDCVAWGGSHSETGLTCDFQAYYGNSDAFTWEDALATWSEEDLEAFYLMYGQQREATR